MTEIPATLSPRKAYWLEHLQAYAVSGGHMTTYADHHGLDVQQLYNWKSRFKREGRLPGNVGPELTTELERPSTVTAPQAPALAGQSDGSQASPLPLILLRLLGPATITEAHHIMLPNGIRIECNGLAPERLATIVSACLASRPPPGQHPEDHERSR